MRHPSAPRVPTTIICLQNPYHGCTKDSTSQLQCLVIFLRSLAMCIHDSHVSTYLSTYDFSCLLKNEVHVYELYFLFYKPYPNHQAQWSILYLMGWQKVVSVRWEKVWLAGRSHPLSTKYLAQSFKNVGIICKMNSSGSKASSLVSHSIYQSLINVTMFFSTSLFCHHADIK